MAGDWYPMVFWRSRCPEVVRISSLCGRDRHEVLGWLCDLWSWASSESVDGGVGGVRLCDLPSVIGADARLWEAVREVNWLAEDERGIVIPGWDHWLCESAKKRAKERVKKRRQRARIVPVLSPVRPACPPLTGHYITEDKKEEEKSAGETPAAPPKPPPKSPPTNPPKRFVPPAVEEVAAYCRERGNAVDAQRWHDFYTGKGWMVGKNKMKDWKAAVRTWERDSSGKPVVAAPDRKQAEIDAVFREDAAKRKAG